MAANPTWIEPPPPQKKGLGCFAKGCLVALILGVLFLLLAGGAGYFFVSHGKPTALPVEKISSEELSDVQQRIEQFKSAPPQPSPEQSPQPETTATPSAEQPAQPPKRELRLTASEMNGLIAANPKARGHASVSMSGNTANVQVSIPTDKLPGLPRGYLNGNFSITTNGPTSLESVQVSKVQANGLPVPSDVLSWSYRGRSLMGYALDALAPYNVGTVEIRDGVLYAQ
jgi:hypothetical protein